MSWEGTRRNLGRCQEKPQRLLIPKKKKKKWMTECGVGRPCRRNFLWALRGGSRDPLNLRSSLKEVNLICLVCGLLFFLASKGGWEETTGWHKMPRPSRESGPFSRVFIGVCKTVFIFFPFQLGLLLIAAYSSKSSEHPLTPRQHLPLTPFQLHHPLFLFSVALQQAPDPQGALHLPYFTS